MVIQLISKDVIILNKTYKMNIAGLERELPLFKVSENLCIAAFLMFGDVEMTKKSAEQLLKLAPAHDIMITAECKSIPLLYEMARQADAKDYLVARKSPKVYMEDLITSEVKSITTEKVQTLCIGKKEIEALKGKKVLIVDDVISTGESIKILENLVEKAGGEVVGKMAVLAEGDAAERNDIIFLEKLPLFDKNGDILA